jgi:hypothetical protein
MSKVTETGNAVNIAHFEELISIATSLSTAYNPSKASLKLPQLNTLLNQAKLELATVATKNVAYNNLVNARINLYNQINGLSIRIISVFSTTDASAQTLEDAKAFRRKIAGRRAIKIVASADPNAEAPHTISVAQLSYTNLAEHLYNLVEVIKTEPTYLPNETDLKVTALTSLVSNLKSANTNVAKAHIDLSNARISRNKVLYNANTGLTAIAADVKKYIQGIFGNTSQEYKMVSKLQFRHSHLLYHAL